MEHALDVEPEVTPRRRRLLLLAAPVVVVAVVAGAGWWVTHPDRLTSVGSEAGMQGQVGQPVVVGLFAYPTSGSVELHDAVPRVRPGGAAADVRVAYCSGRPDGTTIGALDTTAAAECSELPPLAGQRLSVPSTENRLGHLVLEIVPREPGEVVVDGVDVTYSAGLQRGTQASGLVVKVVVSG